MFLFFLCAGCKNGNNNDDNTSENNVDAARNFIRAALDGNFRSAKDFMLKDSTNLNYMDVVERSYARTPDEVKAGYRTSAIHIHEVKELNDTTTIVIYSNSYKNDHDTLRIVKQQEKWVVDFKYLYEHDSDSLFSKSSGSLK